MYLPNSSTGKNVIQYFHFVHSYCHNHSNKCTEFDFIASHARTDQITCDRICVERQRNTGSAKYVHCAEFCAAYAKSHIIIISAVRRRLWIPIEREEHGARRCLSDSTCTRAPSVSSMRQACLTPLRCEGIWYSVGAIKLVRYLCSRAREQCGVWDSASVTRTRRVYSKATIEFGWCVIWFEVLRLTG